MMKKLLTLAAFLLASSLPALAQQIVLPCAKVGQTSCAPVSATSPLPVTGTLTTTPSGTQTVTGTVTLGAGAAAVGTVTAVGNVASGVADSGNPVKVGGKYNTAFPALTNGQRGDLQLDASGRVITTTTSTSFVTGQISIGTTATQIPLSQTNLGFYRLTNMGTTDVFCGPSGVTTTTGELLTGTKGSMLTYPVIALVYCVVATGTQTVSYSVFN